MLSAAVVPKLDEAEVERTIAAALQEDLAFGPDVTSEAVIAPHSTGAARFVARECGVVCGLDVARKVLAVVCDDSQFVWQAEVKDGDRVERGEVLCTIVAPLRSLLTAERTMLNFLTHLSGVATATAQWVDAVSATNARIRDTRKTLPGLRMLEKYAVRCGGGVNHRMGLGDMALIKDNHISAAGGVKAAMTAVADASPAIPVEVECDTTDQVREAIACGAQMILLDNMTLDALRESVALADKTPDIELEASGGLTLQNAREVAQTGVDYLAVGALTHSARALDIGLDLTPA